MKNKLLIVIAIVVVTTALSGCEASMMATYNAINSVVIRREPQQTFHDLSKGMEVQVLTTKVNQKITDKTMFHFSGEGFFAMPTAKYVRSMGFTEMSANSDYSLFITINRADFQASYSTAYVDIMVSLKDPKGKEVYMAKNISTMATNAPYTTHCKALDEAYTQALEQINWNRIATFLRTEQLPKEEPQKQVQGYGDTALENTIIRWDVNSRPQGADIFWRVVSKTPEVKSTNNKYLQTTPYEATKSLDIMGLTYQTSGDVRIILRCEKDGYHPQEKEYNVRMVIDQEEISAFFRLVKEEE